jgi:hypothetical protein
MRLRSLEMKNLNVCSENPFAHFEESLRTITQISCTNGISRSIEENDLHRISNHATTEKACMQRFSESETK